MQSIIPISQFSSVQNLRGDVPQSLTGLYLDIDTVLVVEHLHNPAVLHASLGCVYVGHYLAELRFC